MPLLLACSTPNIDVTIKPGNEGFTLERGDVAVVLTHGLGASPFEVKGLADYLAARNITVYAVRLDGHGTSVEHLATTKWADWYRNYKTGFDLAKQKHSKVFAGGTSMGGVLALMLAENENVQGIIAVAPALILDDKRSEYAWLFKYFTKYSSRVIPEERSPYYYNRFPVASVAETVTMAKLVEKDLGKINEPIFIMQSTNDTRVSVKSSQTVYDTVSSKEKELVWVNSNEHIMFYDADKEKYFEQIYQFILKNA